jgi:PleD family two-component response regulator
MEKLGPGPVLSPTALVGLRSPRKIRVLVVDDEKSNVELLCRCLNQEGYEVAAAYNGQEALASVNASAPDLILLDVLMPVLDGLSVCQRLRSEFATRSMPIILLSARNTLEDRLKGLRAGVDDYIGKPFDLEEIKARLEGALRRRRWDLSSHPLTHLPGGPAIEEEVWKRLRIGDPFAFAYIDVDHFKAYNDVYGYEAGDKVIKRLGALLIEAVKGAPDGCAFAGHVGGDDFVFITTIEHMTQIMPAIADGFDGERQTFYHLVDFERGTIQTKNRQGEMQVFPLMSLSVAVVSSVTRRILHYARLAEIASELKRFIKSQPHQGKSLILWDRRRDCDG